MTSYFLTNGQYDLGTDGLLTDDHSKIARFATLDEAKTLAQTVNANRRKRRLSNLKIAIAYRNGRSKIVN